MTATTTTRTRRAVRTAPAAPKAIESAAKPTTRRAAKSKAAQVEPKVARIRETPANTADLLAPGVEPKRDFSKLLDKAPNALHAEFKAWFEGHADGEAELDLRTIQLVLATYSEFQNSPSHKAKTIENRKAAAQAKAEREAATLARLEKQAEKLAALRLAQAKKDAGVK